MFYDEVPFFRLPSRRQLLLALGDTLLPALGHAASAPRSRKMMATAFCPSPHDLPSLEVVDRSSVTAW